jgi:hypothetical protein
LTTMVRGRAHGSARRILTSIAVVGLALLPTGCRGSALEKELEPVTFNRLPQMRAAEVLQEALRRGLLKYRSTSEVEAWLVARPNSWGNPESSNPLRAYNSAILGLSPESQAWLLVAVHRVMPELEHPSPVVDDPQWPFNRLDFRGAWIGDPVDHPAAAAIVADRIRANLAAWKNDPAAPRVSLGSPLAEFQLLVGARPGDPQLASDARRVASLLQSNGTWSPAAQIALGRTLLGAAEKAHTDSDRAALVRPATDLLIDGEARFSIGRTTPMSRMYSTYTNKEEPIIREIESRFLERASKEACPNFGEELLPISREALTSLWLDRFGKSADALCIWYPPHWAPVSEIMAKRPDAARNLVVHPDRFGDGLRREILIQALAPHLFVDGDWSGKSDRETLRFCKEDPRPPCEDFADPAFGRAIREEMKPPVFRLDLDSRGDAVVDFRDPQLARAWSSRAAARNTGPPDGPADLAALSALLGVTAEQVRPLIEKEFIPRGCRQDRLPAQVWVDPEGRWRLAELGCAGSFHGFTGPLPFLSAVWPRSASDEEAVSWLVWNFQPLILADAKGVRPVWLPERLIADTRGEKRITGFFDLDGEILIVVQSFAGPCDGPCGADDLQIEMGELTQNVISYLRNGTRKKP